MVERKAADLAELDAVDIELGLEEIQQTIKNYCNIHTIPEALNFTATNMTVDLLRYEYYKKRENDPTVQTDTQHSDNISSIAMGDTTITLGVETASGRKVALKSHQAMLDSLILNYKEQLNKYRRMVW